MDNLSKESKAKLVEWDYKYKEEFDRMSWDDYFLTMAFLVARRSHDPQTQCGCVIISKDKEVIATGYNGYMRGINDDILPNLRPEKYTWMIHSEHNAVLSAARRGVSLDGATVYVTGPPCIYCLQYMYQAGIKHIVHSTMNVHNKHKDETVEREIIETLTKDGLTIEEKQIDATSVSSNLKIITGKMINGCEGK